MESYTVFAFIDTAIFAVLSLVGILIAMLCYACVAAWIEPFPPYMYIMQSLLLSDLFALIAIGIILGVDALMKRK